MSYQKNIISTFLNSTSGKMALGSAMIEPIRKRLDYQGIARRALIINQIETYYHICY